MGLEKIIKDRRDQAWQPNMTVSLKPDLIYDREGCPNLKTLLL